MPSMAAAAAAAFLPELFRLKCTTTSSSSLSLSSSSSSSCAIHHSNNNSNHGGSSSFLGSFTCKSGVIGFRPKHRHCVAASVSSSAALWRMEVALQPKQRRDVENDDGGDDYYVNLGTAIRTLRDELPHLFARDLSYDIYRDDITFSDPMNTFRGLEQYRLMMWALRFHGRVLFRAIWMEVGRIWQPSERVILVRWTVRGVPRVPWEAQGRFDGTSRYKLDRHGRIYEHHVDNLAFNLPEKLRPSSALDLVRAAGCPTPTFSSISGVLPLPLSLSLLPLTATASTQASTWLKLYDSVKDTLDLQQVPIVFGCC